MVKQTVIDEDDLAERAERLAIEHEQLFAAWLAKHDELLRESEQLRELGDRTEAAFRAAIAWRRAR